MSRRGQATQRDVAPDPKYGSETVARFINKVMVQGKKSTAQGIVYGAIDICEQRLNQPGIAQEIRGIAQGTNRIPFSSPLEQGPRHGIGTR